MTFNDFQCSILVVSTLTTTKNFYDMSLSLFLTFVSVLRGVCFCFVERNVLFSLIKQRKTNVFSLFLCFFCKEKNKCV